MTDDPDLLTVAGHAATDLFTMDGRVATHLLRVLGEPDGYYDKLFYPIVRDKIADALGCHLAALKRELAAAKEEIENLQSEARGVDHDFGKLLDKYRGLERELAEKDRLILAQAERTKAQSELLSRRAETP